MDQKHVLKLKVGKSSGQFVYVSVFTDGSTKFMEFTDNPDKDESEIRSKPIPPVRTEADIYEFTETVLEVKEIGISIIGPTKGSSNRKEICYITASNMEYSAIQAPDWNTTDFKLQSL